VTLSAGGYEAVFLPDVGMLGASLKHEGVELLSLHGGVAAFRDGHTTGLPLLAPWANRLSRKRFRVSAREIDLDGIPGLHYDANGLPIHGTMVGPMAWRVVYQSADALRARYDYDQPAFPFPHRVEIEAIVSEKGLEVRTRVRPTSKRRVPISFGWHPYFRLPAPKDECVLHLPARGHLELDESAIPTGVSTAEPAEAIPLGGRTFDDLYSLGKRQLSLEGGGRRLELRLQGYPFAQIYMPPGQRFIALEPMTAPIDALVTGGGLRLLEPGQLFTAIFTVSVR
jgi:aldose 1-epimerase